MWYYVRKYYKISFETGNETRVSTIIASIYTLFWAEQQQKARVKIKYNCLYYQMT